MSTPPPCPRCGAELPVAKRAWIDSDILAMLGLANMRDPQAPAGAMFRCTCQAVLVVPYTDATALEFSEQVLDVSA